MTKLVLPIVGLGALMGVLTASSCSDKVSPETKPVVRAAAQTEKDIEIYKTMLWVNAQVDNGLDCKPIKQKLEATDINAAGLEALQRDYDSCFGAGLYHHSYHLPFLTLGMSHGHGAEDVKYFRAKMTVYDELYADVKTQQEKLGFPQPAQILDMPSVTNLEALALGDQWTVADHLNNMEQWQRSDTPQKGTVTIFKVVANDDAGKAKPDRIEINVTAPEHVKIIRTSAKPERNCKYNGHIWTEASLDDFEVFSDARAPSKRPHFYRIFKGGYICDGMNEPETWAALINE